jgi:hypothetical protein
VRVARINVLERQPGVAAICDEPALLIGRDPQILFKEPRFILCLPMVWRVWMAGVIEGVSRDRTTLFPERLDDGIGEDHVVRVVDMFVDQFGLGALGFQRHAAARSIAAWRLQRPERG